MQDSIILDSNVYWEYIKENEMDLKIKALLEALDGKNVQAVSRQLTEAFDRKKLPAKIIKFLLKETKVSQDYTVSSAQVFLGQMEGTTLKGQTVLGVQDSFTKIKGIVSIEDAILNCYKSMFTENYLTYLCEHGLKPQELSMAVIVQKEA